MVVEVVTADEVEPVVEVDGTQVEVPGDIQVEVEVLGVQARSHSTAEVARTDGRPCSLVERLTFLPFSSFVCLHRLKLMPTYIY